MFGLSDILKGAAKVAGASVLGAGVGGRAAGALAGIGKGRALKALTEGAVKAPVGQIGELMKKIGPSLKKFKKAPVDMEKYRGLFERMKNEKKKPKYTPVGKG